MKQLYSVNVQICATAYIKADNAESALAIAKSLEGKTPAIPLYWTEGEVPIDGKEFDNPSLPDISLSPAMTIHGPWCGEKPSLV